MELISFFEIVFWNDIHVWTLFLKDLDWNKDLFLTYYLINIIQVCCTCIYSVTKEINYVMHWGFDWREKECLIFIFINQKMPESSFWQLIYNASKPKVSYSFFMIARCLTLPRSALLWDRLPPTIFSLVLSCVAHLSIILSDTSMW